MSLAHATASLRRQYRPTLIRSHQAVKKRCQGTSSFTAAAAADAHSCLINVATGLLLYVTSLPCQVGLPLINVSVNRFNRHTFNMGNLRGEGARG